MCRFFILNYHKKIAKRIGGFYKKYHIDRNANLLFSRRHRSSKIFPDLRIWGRDRMSLNCRMIHRKLLYTSSQNCKPTGLVTMLNILHICSNYNVSNCVAHMCRHYLQNTKLRLIVVSLK